MSTDATREEIGELRRRIGILRKRLDDGPQGASAGEFLTELLTLLEPLSIEGGGECTNEEMLCAGKPQDAGSLQDQRAEWGQAALLDYLRDAVIISDLDDRIVLWNRGAERLYGWTRDEAIGAKLQSIIGSEECLTEIETTSGKQDNNDEWARELRQFTKDRREIIVLSRQKPLSDDVGRPRSKLLVNTDITEKRDLEAQLLRAQRLDSMGTLAAGLAHDIHNVLSPILIAVEALRHRVVDEEGQTLLALLKVNTERGAGFINQMLSLANGRGTSRSVLKVEYLIREVVQILTRTLPRSIEIRTQLQDGLWTIVGDPTQLHQVLTNLCVNARDAMPEGGTLTIRAANAEAPEEYCKASGRFVLISVTDTGIGISRDLIDEVFEPFFTTKEVGHGMGLGLATVLKIVKAHGGFIDLSSEVGKGTEFTMLLPATDSEAADDLEVGLEQVPGGNGELILVVESKLVMRIALEKTLEAHGYRVLSTRDESEAVDLHARNRNEVKVVLLDLLGSKVNWLSCLQAMRQIDPDIKTIATCGPRLDENLAEATRSGLVAEVLRKPYTTEDLLKALSMVLNAC
jgi:PAS domain S-box-containing protein